MFFLQVLFADTCYIVSSVERLLDVHLRHDKIALVDLYIFIADDKGRILDTH